MTIVRHAFMQDDSSSFHHYSLLAPPSHFQCSHMCVSVCDTVSIEHIWKQCGNHVCVCIYICIYICGPVSRVPTPHVMGRVWCPCGGVFTYIHTYIPTYLPTYLHTYIPTYLHTYVPTYLRTHVRTYIHTCIHTYIHTCVHTYTHTHIHTQTYIHTYLPTCLPTYLHTYIPYLHTYIPTYPRTYIHTYLPTYIHTYMHTYIHTYQHTNILPPQATGGGPEEPYHHHRPRGGGTRRTRRYCPPIPIGGGGGGGVANAAPYIYILQYITSLHVTLERFFDPCKWIFELVELAWGPNRDSAHSADSHKNSMYIIYNYITFTSWVSMKFFDGDSKSCGQTRYAKSCSSVQRCRQEKTLQVQPFSCHLQSSFGFLSQRESDRAARTMVWRSFLIVTSYNIVSFIACCNLIDVLCVIVIYCYIIYICISMIISHVFSCHVCMVCGFVLYKYRPSSPVKHLILSFGAGWKTSSWNTATCLFRRVLAQQPSNLTQDAFLINFQLQDWCCSQWDGKQWRVQLVHIYIYVCVYTYSRI